MMQWMGWTSALLCGAWAPSDGRTKPVIFETSPVIECCAPRSRAIDLALCLDTSGSMDGLIEAAKQKLWGIVNELARVRPVPALRVALLTYGNDGYAAEEGWVKVDLDLTGDLDAVSQRLFALTTNGGTELVGRVVARAVRSLGWSGETGALKLVVVAGNESADQDTEIRASAAASEAIQHGILVNAIFCGNPAAGDASSWLAVAQAADGQFACIDQQAIAIATPFDVELADLSATLNQTYLPLGTAGQAGWKNQFVQDSNARGLNSEAAAERAICKAGVAYSCSWDLVDACRAGTVKLEEVPAAELPEPMRAMDAKERQAYVDAQGKKRAEIQEKLAEVGRSREAWITEQRAQGLLAAEHSLDGALLQALRAQASQAGFEVNGR
jgi:hypothetical protein